MNTEKNPWEVLETELKYDNAWIRVEHHKVLNPSQKEGVYGVVHFKNIAVGVVPIDEHGNTWLVGQFRFPLNEYSWEIPEGGCPSGEDIETTAHRELKEETGLLAGKMTLMGKIHTSNSVCNEVAYLFVAEDLRQTEAEPEETEQLQVRKLPFTEALQMVMNNEITDSMSVAAILKMAQFRALQSI